MTITLLLANSALLSRFLLAFLWLLIRAARAAGPEEHRRVAWLVGARLGQFGVAQVVVQARALLWVVAPDTASP